MKLLSHVWLFAIPWTVAEQAPPSMEFCRQEYWSTITFSRGLSWPMDQTQVSHIAADTLPSEPPGHSSSGCMALERLWGDIPHPRAKEKPQQDGRRGKSMFRIKPHTHQRCSEVSNIPCAHQDLRPHRDWENCVWVSPEEVLVSSGLPQGQGLWMQ